jgi:hypothetical protein
VGTLYHPPSPTCAMDHKFLFDLKRGGPKESADTLVLIASATILIIVAENILSIIGYTIENRENIPIIELMEIIICIEIR